MFKYQLSRLLNHKLAVLFFSYLLLAHPTANISAQTEHLLTFYVREYPNIKEIPKNITQKILNYARQHHKVLIPGELEELAYRLLIKKHTPAPSDYDLFAVHAGFIGHTDQNGQLILPRRVQNDQLKLVITPTIIPVFSANNNIDHWQLDPTQPAQAFTISKKLDPLTDQLYWEVQPAPLPPDQPITAQILIILGDPNTIYLPTDLTPTTADPQLLLPDIYIKQPTNSTRQALIQHTIQHLLTTPNIRPFYSPLKKLAKRVPYGIATQTVT